MEIIPKQLIKTLALFQTMEKLMEIYKKCRFFDRLLDTNFFHETKFMGLVERVRRVSSNLAVSRAIDHVNRLFSEAPAGPPTVAVTSPPAQHPLKMPPMSPSGTVHMKSSIKQKQYKITLPEICFDDPTSSTRTQSRDDSPLDTTYSDFEANMHSSSARHFGFAIHRPSRIAPTDEKLSVNTDLANSVSTADSGNHTKTTDDIGEEASGTSSAEVTTNDVSLSKQDACDHTSNSCCSIEGNDRELSEYACARLCTLLKGQLELAVKEITERYKTLKESESQQSNVSAQDSNTVKSLDMEKTGEASATDDLPHSNSTPTTQLPSTIVPSTEHFVLLETSPPSHFFAATLSDPVNAAQFYRTVCFDHNLLQSSMPPGVWCRVYEDRMDLLSVMIAGPEHTPYEDGMFLFDIQLGKNYPRSPPSCHYISFCADRLNPNLYEDGKVCVSLLGTWAGKGSEVWGPSSTLLQVIVSIQGLILVAEPYFNEAGYEKQKGMPMHGWRKILESICFSFMLQELNKALRILACTTKW